MTVLRYDVRRHRLWIAGQRCHHGATGVVLSTAAAGTLVATRRHISRLAALLTVGGLLMAHDWHDRAVWFERGAQADREPA